MVPSAIVQLYKGKVDKVLAIKPLVVPKNHSSAPTDMRRSLRPEAAEEVRLHPALDLFRGA